MAKNLLSKIAIVGLATILFLPSCSKKYYADINKDDIKEVITYEKNSNGDYNIIANIARSEGIEQEVLKTINFKPEDLDFSYINNDGNIDILIGRYIPNTEMYELLFSQGDKKDGFGELKVLKRFEKKPDEIYVTNMKEGDLSDIIIGEEMEDSYKLSISKNNGNGFFGKFKNLKNFKEKPKDIFFSDMNGDRNNDIVVGENNGLDYDISVFKNNGENILGDKELIKRLEEIPNGINMTDIDGDGDLDIILHIGGTFTGKIEGVKYKALLNDGKGEFNDIRNVFTSGDSIFH